MRDQRGAVAVWTAMSLVGFIVALGIGVDFAGHAAATQDARAVAAEAARAAGQQVELSGTRASIDVPLAVRAAQDYVAASHYEGAVSVDGSDVRVEVSGRYECQFLGIIGIDQLAVTAQATAESVTVVNGRVR